MGTMTPLFASLIIVCRATDPSDRHQALRECLRSLARAQAPFRWELILVFNGPSVYDLDPPEGLGIRSLRCPPSTPAAARNFALSLARGEWIAFLDDDVIVPVDYLENYGRALRADPLLEIAGGPDRTPPGAGWTERAIGLALQSPIATGSTRARHGGSSSYPRTDAGDRELILCNLWFRASIFHQEGFRFDEDFERNEENVLLNRLKGRRALHHPRLLIYHRRKTSLRRLTRAIFRSGYFRARSLFRIHSPRTVEFMAPSAFVTYLFAFPFLPGSALARLPWVAYVLLNLFFSAKLALSREGRAALLPVISFYQLLIVGSYGIGFISGLLSRLGLILSQKDHTQNEHSRQARFPSEA